LDDEFHPDDDAHPVGGGGGIFGVLKRVAGGGSLFMTEYRAIGVPGGISFATKLPGHIVPIEVGPGHEYMIHRHGFLCATPQIQSVGIQQSLGAGIFGGDGFLLQHVSGTGTAWIELSGELIMKDLQPGETLRVHPGHVGAFQASVSFQITTVPGIKNMIFGGDGIFLASLSGPGRIWLQTLPISKLAHKSSSWNTCPRSTRKQCREASSEASWAQFWTGEIRRAHY
jgi:uncharacterized protein (AIM24 family)